MRLNSLVWVSSSSCHLFTISSTDLPRNAEGGTAATVVGAGAVPVIVPAAAGVTEDATGAAGVVVAGLAPNRPPANVGTAGVAVSAMHNMLGSGYWETVGQRWLTFGSILFTVVFRSGGQAKQATGWCGRSGSRAGSSGRFSAE